jgi:O-acetylhomoserine/O-acetylserine sulfhydrylase-like pyridoxal-dependent enzyme
MQQVNKLRFTYRPEYDTHGNLIGTTLVDTGGYFANWKPEDLAKIAEHLTPKYSGGNMSETFTDIYFNHCLRKELESCEKGLASLSVQLSSEPAGVR